MVFRLGNTKQCGNLKRDGGALACKRRLAWVFLPMQYTSHNRLWVHMAHTYLLSTLTFSPLSERTCLVPHHESEMSSALTLPHDEIGFITPLRSPKSGSPDRTTRHNQEEQHKDTIESTSTVELDRYHDRLPNRHTSTTVKTVGTNPFVAVVNRKLVL